MSDGGRGDSRPPDRAAARAAPAEEVVPAATESGERSVANGAGAPTANGSARASSPAIEPPPESMNRRSSHRIAVTWSVDCETEDTFLYASITNISEMGIFVRTTDPLPVGTQLTLRFAPSGPSGGPSGGSTEHFVLSGVVQWINPLREDHDNPNPGMGIRFLDLDLDDRERIVATIHTIAYLRDDPRAN
jgi:type IV pilus assembly protein PilZ